MLLHAAKAWTLLVGRDFVTPDEVQTMALPVWRHRLLLRPEVELEGATPDSVLRGLLRSTPVPR
jgi:MoxR-like ATPase